MANERHSSTLGLFADVVSQLAGLFQNELQLLRAEFGEKIRRLIDSGALVGGGAVALLAALLLLLRGLVRWLEVAGIPDQWGYLIVGTIVGVAGWFALQSGLAAIKRSTLVPDRAVDQLRADFDTVKEHVG
ncbi:MAG TPA: phage holin family protein [Bauldia sp.]|nr:phage holin family protein [Bauldia sp.]